MKKYHKILLASLGGVYAAFGIFIPITVALLLITVYQFSNFSSIFLMGVGIISSIYKAISIGFLNEA